MSTTVIGKIGHHQTRPERLAIISPDGSARHWFSADTTDAEVRSELVRCGYVVADDGTVTQEAK